MTEFSYNSEHEVAVSDAPKPSKSAKKPPGAGEIEDFFQRMPANFRWPKPDPEAVAAAVEAIQRASGASAAAELAATMADASSPTNVCSACGGSLPEGVLFCVHCGSARDGVAPSAASQHVHHHFHHLVPAPGSVPAVPAPLEPDSTKPRGRAPGSPGPAPGGRAEAAARQLVQDWAQACNTRHIDDLVELYSPDASLIRASVPPVRSLPAIREFLSAVLAAGLGDVEMDSLRLEVMGDIAMDLGRCKMLVPTPLGKRREERGKYLMVLVRQPVGTWKILADCWSTDLSVIPPGSEASPKK